MAERKELPRCQYPIPDQYHVDEEDCNEPAVAVWVWNDGDCFYVCETHDEAVKEADYPMEWTPELEAAYEAATREG